MKITILTDPYSGIQYEGVTGLSFNPIEEVFSFVYRGRTLSFPINELSQWKTTCQDPDELLT